MKKLLFIAAIVLTVVLALCVTSFASLDSMYINANTLDGNNVPGVVGQDQIKIDKGDKLYILGWAAKDGTNLEKVVWTLDGVEKECSDVYTSRTDLINHLQIDAAYVGHAGIGANNNYMELLGVDALDDGVYWCSVIAKFEDGTRQTLKAAFQLVVGSAKGGTFGTLIPRGNNPISVRTHKFGVKVTVPDGYLLTSVTGIASPTWGNTGNGSDCAATAYAWKGDYATSVAGEIVGYAEEINHTDNVNMPFIFDRALPAGEYVIVLGGIGEKSIGFWCGSDLGEADAVFYDGEPAPETDYYPGLNYVLEKEHYKHLNIDYVWLTSGSEVNENSGRGSDLGNIKAVVDSGAQFIRLIGWYYPPKQIADFGYQVDDGEIVYDSIACTFDQGTADIIRGFGEDYADADWYRNFSGDVPIQEGEHSVRLIVKFQDGTTDSIYETKYVNDDSNIALGKPVITEISSGAANGLPYWSHSFLTDGSKWVHNTNVVDGKPLGWVVNPDPNTGVGRAKIYVDLQGIYDLSRIKLHSMGFISETFPSAYNLYTSVDGENWDLVQSVTGRAGARDTADPYVFETSNRARFIGIEIPDTAAIASLGEIEAYGTFVEEASGDIIPHTLYPNFKSYWGENSGSTGGDTIWLGHTSGRLSTSFTFTTDVPFWAIGFPDYWSSANTPVKFVITDKDGNEVWNAEYVKAGDGPEAFPFFSDMHDLPAGEYTCTVTLNDDTKNEEGNYTHWLVIGHGTQPLGTEYIANQYGKAGFWLFVKEGVTGGGFAVREYRQHANIDAIYLDGEDKGKTEGLDIETDENSSSIKVHGWLAANYPIEKYGYKVDGGEAVWDASFMGTDPGTPENPNGDYAAIMNVAKDLFSVPGNGYRADVIVPVEAGSHEVEIVAFVNGEERHIITFTYGEKEVPVATPVEIESNNKGDVAGVWLRPSDDEDIMIEFKTNQAFTAFNIPVYWASNPPQFGDLKANIEVSLYKFDKNLRKTLEGTPVATAKYLENLGDNNVSTPFSAPGTGATLTNYSADNKGFSLILDAPAEAGQYVVVIRNDAGAGSYVVLPSASAADAVLGTDYIKYFFKSDEQSFSEAVRFTLTLVDEGAFVTLDADEIDQPDEPNPGTGNTLAIFAVIVTLALAAVVVLKKRAF